MCWLETGSSPGTQREGGRGEREGRGKGGREEEYSMYYMYVL